jgi:hypothetical protein
MPSATPKRRWLTCSLRTFLLATLGVALVVGYIGRARIAAEHQRRMQELIATSFSNSAWIERPKVIGKPTAQDAAARTALLEVFERKQDREFRKKYRIVIPDHSTGLPQDYDVLVYGKYIDRAARRLEMHVRGGKVWAELATDDEFRRGELPAEIVDGMVRQLSYGFLARQELRDPNDDDFSFSGGGSHSPDIQIEVFSCDKASPLLLKPKPRQLIASNIAPHFDGVEEYVHARFCNGLTQLIEDKLPVLQPNDELKQELVQRLKAVGAPTNGGLKHDSLDADPAIMPLDYYRRNDLLAVESLICSRLAIAWRVPQAAPELRRLSLSTAEAQLAIAVADQPDELLYVALTGEDWDMFTFATDFIEDHLTVERIDLLVQSLPNVKDDYRREEVFKRLMDAHLTAHQLAAIDRVREGVEGTGMGIAATQLLLVQTQRASYYDELMKLATDHHDKELAARAAGALLAYSVDKGTRKPDSLELVRSILDRRPADAPQFAGYLGKLGDSSDLSRLERCLRKDDGWVTSIVVESMADIDPKRACEHAREQIREYLRHPVARHHSYRWNVYEYVDLIFWRHDADSVELLKSALAEALREQPDAESWQQQGDLLLKYLGAESTAERLPLALEYVYRFRPLREDWIQDVGEQLIVAGADPAACEELLKPTKRPGRR